jgi:hypothetical protein
VRRPFAQGFAGRELLEAKFEGKQLEPIAGTEGSGEGFTVNQCDHVVGPAKMLLHILLRRPSPCCWRRIVGPRFLVMVVPSMVSWTLAGGRRGTWVQVV